MNIVHNIPGISHDEVLDCYMRGIKQVISKELYTRECTDRNSPIVEAARFDPFQLSLQRNNPTPSLPSNQFSNTPTPMYISSVLSGWKG